MREQVDRLLSRERNKKSAHSRGRERAMGPGQNQVGSQRKIQNTKYKYTKSKYQNHNNTQISSMHAVEGGEK